MKHLKQEIFVFLSFLSQVNFTKNRSYDQKVKLENKTKVNDISKLMFKVEKYNLWLDAQWKDGFLVDVDVKMLSHTNYIHGLVLLVIK